MLKRKTFGKSYFEYGFHLHLIFWILFKRIPGNKRKVLNSIYNENTILFVLYCEQNKTNRENNENKKEKKEKNTNASTKTKYSQLEYNEQKHKK